MVAGAASLSAVLPVVLVALGVGSIAYAISKSDDFEKEVEDCGDFVKRNGGKIFTDIGKLLGPSIQINYYDNRTYIDELTLKLIARWAIENGYFESSETEYRDPVTSGNFVTIDSLCSLYDYLEYLGFEDDYYFPVYNFLIDKDANLFGVHITYRNNRIYRFNVGYVKIDLPFYHVYDSVNSSSLSYNRFILSNIDTIIVAPSYNSDGTYKDFVSSRSVDSNYSFVWSSFFSTNGSSFYSSNVGVYGGSGSSVSNNIPTLSGDNVGLPNWVNDIYSISNNNYYTITMPSEYQIPVMAPIDYDFNDLPVNITIPDFQWDPPYEEGDQSFFQGGDYYFYPIVDNPVGDVSVISENFLTPASILEKFPFCVPSDMVKASRIFLSASGPSAPRYEQVINFAGTNIDTSIDLSRFDGVASIARKMEYILFLGGLMYVSIWLFKR